MKIKKLFHTEWLIIAAAFTATVIFLTHLPNESVPDPLRLSGLDKLAHIAVYGAITFLFFLSLRCHISLLIASLLFFAILAIGTVDELTQPRVNRTASLSHPHAGSNQSG